MNVSLGDIAQVLAGFPFRTRIVDDPSASVRVVQMGNVDDDLIIAWDSVATTPLRGRRMPDWLTDGDILVAAKGSRPYAVLVQDVPGEAVCDTNFFHVTAVDPARVLPAFLAAYINDGPGKDYLRRSSEGSRTRNLRKGALMSMPVHVPSMQVQRRLVALRRDLDEERLLLQAMIDNRAETFAACLEQAARGIYDDDD